MQPTIWGCLTGLVLFCALARGAVILTPLTSFAGDGWLAPGEGGYAFVGTASLERGLAYGNGHLYLVSRNGGTNVRILDAISGADLGALNVAGVSGGTFAVNSAATGGDGAIYVGNLVTSGTALKIYRWTSEAASPTVVYNSVALTGARAGDSLAAIGSGSATRLAAGYSGSPDVPGDNGYAIINPTTGTSVNVGFAGTPPDPGDFRLGLTFIDADHVLGSQGHNVYRYTGVSGSNGTLIASPTLVAGERLLAYSLVHGMPLLATLNTTDSVVKIYDATNPETPALLTSGTTTRGALTANGNFTGQLAWGETSGYSATLYAMSTNQGIQAFSVSVPEPRQTAVPLAMMFLGIVWRVRQRDASM